MCFFIKKFFWSNTYAYFFGSFNEHTWPWNSKLRGVRVACFHLLLNSSCMSLLYYITTRSLLQHIAASVCFFALFLWQATFSLSNKITMLLCKIVYLGKKVLYMVEHLFWKNNIKFINACLKNFGYMCMQYYFLFSFYFLTDEIIYLI